MLKGQKVTLREKRLEDAATDYAWRSDEELACLDAAPPLQLPFEVYLVGYADELSHPSRRRRRFAIEDRDGKHIGNCMYYEFEESGERRARLGISIGERSFWGRGYGSDAVATLADHIFGETRVETLYLETLEQNVRAQRCFERNGFASTGSIIRGEHAFISMERSRPKSRRDSSIDDK